MDLTKPGNYPRSGREALGGIVFFPRSIDKMRAHIAGTAGDYNATRGLSSRLFDLFGVTAEQFEEAVRQSKTDDDVLRWLQQNAPKKPTQAEIDAYNQTILNRAPQDEEGRARFRANLAKLGFGHRTDVTTFVDAEDLEEGREVPQRTAGG